VGTAERDKSMLKAASVKSNRSLNAVSDGAFAATPLNAQDRTAKHSMRN